MKLKENIFESIESMDTYELTLIYEYINLLKKQKKVPQTTKSNISIDQIHAMTSSSEESWSKAVIEDREDRV
ncbi:MAG: hypothetical protein HQK62_09425 [Desulfamplus sp.]|nr:hypothetical protein [Desulfamplus sp.]